MPTLSQPLIMPGVRLDKDAARESARALSLARAPYVAGFCLFGGEAAQVAALCGRLRQQAGRELLLASDMERGAGQQVQGLTRLCDLGILGYGGAPVEARAMGRLTAAEARSVGINVLFAPVLDVRSRAANPIVGMRALGHDPAQVAALGIAFARGAWAGGCLPVAKHFPGHGATVSDSHDDRPVVQEPADIVRERDLSPFLAYARSLRPAAFMTAHVAYPTLDASGVIATFSPALVAELRSAARAPALVFTDALLMQGALDVGSEAEAAARSIRAGADVLLYPSDPEDLAASWLAGHSAAEQRHLQSLARAAAKRVDRTVQRLARKAPTLPRAADLRHVERAARRAVERVGGLWREKSALLFLDEDLLEGRGETLLRRAKDANLAYVQVLPPEPKGVELPRAAATATLVVCASPRAWKGAAGASPSTQERIQALRASAAVQGTRLRVLLLASMGEAEAVLYGTGPQVEAAVATRLFGRRKAMS